MFDFPFVSAQSKVRAPLFANSSPWRSLRGFLGRLHIASLLFRKGFPACQSSANLVLQNRAGAKDFPARQAKLSEIQILIFLRHFPQELPRSPSQTLRNSDSHFAQAFQATTTQRVTTWTRPPPELGLMRRGLKFKIL